MVKMQTGDKFTACRSCFALHTGAAAIISCNSDNRVHNSADQNQPSTSTTDMTGIQQEQEKEYAFTSVPSTGVRLGRLWVDYAEANNMPIRQRVGETNRYVWLEQTPHQWYSAMLYAHWYIVSHSTGWNSRRSASTKRLVAAAKRAYRQLMRQSPAEWHEWLRDESAGHEPVSPSESFTTWHVQVRRSNLSDGDVICTRMAIQADPEDVLREALAARGCLMAYDPIRDSSGDDCWGKAWRVWCVDPSASGWMTECIAQVVPFITLMYHREETFCGKPGCDLCDRSV